MGVLQGVALTIPMDCDIGHVLPLQGEPAKDIGADGEDIPSGAALQRFRSMVEQKAGMLARSGILMEAGAIAGAMLIHGFVLTMPEGPLLVRQGDVGAATHSPPTVLEMGMGAAGEACKPTLDGDWPKSKSRSLTVTTSRCAEGLSSPPRQDLDAINVAPFCSMVPFLRRCERRVRLWVVSDAFAAAGRGGVWQPWEEFSDVDASVEAVEEDKMSGFLACVLPGRPCEKPVRWTSDAWL